MEIIMVKDNEFKYRIAVMFSLRDCCCVFRSNDPMKYTDISTDYTIKYSCEFGFNSYKDYLEYLLIVNRCGDFKLISGDVVGIRINGTSLFFRFVDIGNVVFTDSPAAFKEIKNFITQERNDYISLLHKNNKVLDIGNNQELAISEIDKLRTNIFAFQSETYLNQFEKSDMVYTDYSLYQYDIGENKIYNASPYDKPFCDIDAALRFYRYGVCDHDSDEDFIDILLLNKKELYMIKDYFDLQNVLLGKE